MDPAAKFYGPPTVPVPAPDARVIAGLGALFPAHKFPLVPRPKTRSGGGSGSYYYCATVLMKVPPPLPLDAAGRPQVRRRR